MHPIKKTARIAGGFYLLNIVTIWSAIFFFRGLFVSGNPTATATNLTSHSALFHLGFASELISTACSICVTALLYELLKPINRSISLLAAFFRLVGCFLAVLGYVLQLGSFRILTGGPKLTVLNLQDIQSLSVLLSTLRAQNSNILVLFFGLHFILIGYLIFKSSFLPRALGLLVAFAGFCCLTFLFPPLGGTLFPYFIPIGLAAEISLATWLSVRAVNIDRWVEQAAAEKLIIAN